MSAFLCLTILPHFLLYAGAGFGTVLQDDWHHTYSLNPGNFAIHLAQLQQPVATSISAPIDLAVTTRT
jgi:hypothetical protein